MMSGTISAVSPWALGIPDRAETLLASLTKRLAAIREEARVAVSRPTVAAIEWLEPLMAGGNWMPDLIEIAGGHSLFGAPQRTLVLAGVGHSY